jgi:hypothetical protein
VRRIEIWDEANSNLAFINNHRHFAVKNHEEVRLEIG